MSTRIKAILRVFGAVTALSSLIILPSLLLAALWHENTVLPFIEAMLPTLAAGSLLWFSFRNNRYELRLRDGFLITGGIWLIASLVTAIPFYLALPQLTLHRCRVRVHLRPDHHRRHHADRAGQSAEEPAVLPFLAEFLRRHGHRDPGRGGAADAEDRRHAPVQGRKHRTGQGQQAHPAHRGNGAHAVGGLSRPERAVRAGVLVRRHEPVRCGQPCHDYHRHRRFLDPRRQLRLLEQPADRDHRDRVHAARRHQLQPALVCLAGAPRSAITRPTANCAASWPSPRCSSSSSRCICWWPARSTATASRSAPPCSRWFRTSPPPATSAPVSRTGPACCRS